jgi:hypothetical protein
MNMTETMKEKTRIHSKNDSFPRSFGSLFDDPAGRVHYVKKVVLFR